jgi:hypothetical protein
MTVFFPFCCWSEADNTSDIIDAILHAVDLEVIKLRSQVPFVLKQSKHGTVFEKNWLDEMGYVACGPGHTSFRKGDEAHLLCVLAYRQS